MKKFILLLLAFLLLVSCSVNNNTNDVQEDSELEENYIENFYFESQRNIWGADPGLGINVLHELGYTGKGAIVAYADGKVLVNKHEQFSDADIVYEDFPAGGKNEWHGNGVLSLLLGKNIGTAPDCKCYYFGYEPKSDDHQPIADVIREVIRVNSNLPEDQKIRMLGFSNNIKNIHASIRNNDDAIKATQEARDAGIMMFYCGENGALYYKEGTNRNDPENCYEIPMWEGLKFELSCIPAATRTAAYTGNTYLYDDENDPGLSWTQPFAIGLYAIGISIDPTLTEQEIRDLNVSTAFVNSRGMRIINPCEFVATILERVGRDDDAKEVREAYKASLENYDYQKYDDIRCKDESLKKDAVEYTITNSLGEEENINFSVSPYNYQAEQENEVSYKFDNGSLDESLVNISNLTFLINEEGNYKFSFSCVTKGSMYVYVADSPDGDIIGFSLGCTSDLKQSNYSFEVTKANMDKIKNSANQLLLIEIFISDADRAFVLIDVNQFE